MKAIACCWKPRVNRDGRLAAPAQNAQNGVASTDVAVDHRASVVQTGLAILEGHLETMSPTAEFAELEVPVSQIMQSAPTSFNSMANHLSGPSEPRMDRYTDVLPYEHNRVRLESGAYINASRVSSEPDDLSAPWSFIATQGPLPHTLEDFWRMVLEAKAQTIIMLTRLVEGDRTKCAEYFSPNPDGTFSLGGSLSVTTLEVTRINKDVVRRVLKVTADQGATVHTVSHYQYDTWPDKGVPQETASARILCHLIAAAQLAPGTPRVKPPTIIHCSAGIGRTGTLIAVYVLLLRLRALMIRRDGVAEQHEINEALDVPELIRYLRRGRRGMVQSPQQYSFVYRAVLDELKSGTMLRWAQTPVQVDGVVMHPPPSDRPVGPEAVDASNVD